MSASAFRHSRSPGIDAAVAVRRFVNDEVAYIASRLDGDEGNQFEFLCECGDLSCRRAVRMTVAEYRTHPPGALIGHPVAAACCDPDDPGGHRKAAETHRRAAELHDEAATLHDDHADEIEAKDWPLNRDRARRLADHERELAGWERGRADDQEMKARPEVAG